MGTSGAKMSRRGHGGRRLLGTGNDRFTSWTSRHGGARPRWLILLRWWQAGSGIRSDTAGWLSSSDGSLSKRREGTSERNVGSRAGEICARQDASFMCAAVAFWVDFGEPKEQVPSVGSCVDVLEPLSCARWYPHRDVLRRIFGLVVCSRVH